MQGSKPVYAFLCDWWVETTRTSPKTSFGYVRFAAVLCLARRYIIVWLAHRCVSSLLLGGIYLLQEKWQTSLKKNLERKSDVSLPLQLCLKEHNHSSKNVAEAQVRLLPGGHVMASHTMLDTTSIFHYFQL